MQKSINTEVKRVKRTAQLLLAVALPCAIFAHQAMASTTKPTHCLNIDTIKSSPYWQLNHVNSASGNNAGQTVSVDSNYNNPAEAPYWNRFHVGFTPKHTNESVAALIKEAKAQLTTAHIKNPQPTVEKETFNGNYQYVCNYGDMTTTIALFSCIYDANGDCINA